MAKREMKTKETIVEPEVITSVVEEEEAIKEVEAVKEITGYVIDCSKLNVRKDPKKDAVVLSTIAAKTKVIIDSKGSNKSFYKVKTPTGIEGYCMKQFITIEQ